MRTALQRYPMTGRLIARGMIVFLIASSLATPASANITSVNPASIALCASGGATSTTLTATDDGNVNSNNMVQATVNPSGVVTVTPTGTSKTPTPWTVTSVAAGSATITVSDNDKNGVPKTVPVTVNGPIGLPAPVTLSASQPSITLKTSYPGPSRAVTATVAASPSPVPIQINGSSTSATAQSTGGAGGTVSFTISAVGANGVNQTTAVTLSDGICASQTFNVTVAPGSLSITSATPITLAGPNQTAALTAQEPYYTGPITATSQDQSIATVAANNGTTDPGGATGSVGFTVTSIAPGKTSVSVADNHSQTQSVNVLVNGGSLSLSSSVLNFTVSDNTSGFLSLPPIGVTGTLETTAGGSGHIYVQAPGNITGANGGVLLISYLHYDCSGAVDANTNQGGVFNNTAQPYIQLNAGGNSNDCLTVTDHTGQGQFSNLSFNLNLFLNDYTVPADTYRSGANGNGSFFLTLSAT